MLDTFDRTAGDLNGSTSSDGTFVWTEQATVFVTNGTQLSAPNIPLGTFHSATTSRDAATDSMYVQIDHVSLLQLSADVNVGIALGCNSAYTSGYGFEMSSSGWRIYRQSNDATIASGATDFVSAARTIRFERQGSLLIVSTGGAVIATVTNTAEATGVGNRRAAVTAFGGSTLSTADWLADNFMYDALGGGAPIPRQFPPWFAPLGRNQFPPFRQGVTVPNTDVSVALTGEAMAYSAGTLAPSTTVPLTGASEAYAAGTLAPSSDVPLTGAAEAYVAGTLAPSTSVPIVGSAETYSAGTLTPSTDITLAGSVITFNTGTLSPSGGSGSDVTVALTGVAMTFAAGALAPATSVPLVGAAEAYSAGSLTPSTSVPLTGAAETYSAGALAPSTTVLLAGAAVAWSTGTITYQGDVSVALVGSDMTFQTGTLGVVNDSGGAGSGGDFIIRARRRGSR